MAPISDTEIAFLRLDPQTTRGVAIYDVVNETVKDVASMAGFTELGNRNTCVTSRRGQIAAVINDDYDNKLIVTYTKGNARIKVYREDGTEIDSPETEKVTFKARAIPAVKGKKGVSPKGKAPSSPKPVWGARAASPKPAPKQYRLSPKTSTTRSAAGVSAAKKQ